MPTTSAKMAPVSSLQHAALRAGLELHLPGAAAPRGRCDWPGPEPNQRRGGGQRCRRCSARRRPAAGGKMAPGARPWRWLSVLVPHPPAGSHLLLLLLFLLLLCGQLGGGQKKKEVETFASFALPLRPPPCPDGSAPSPAPRGGCLRGGGRRAAPGRAPAERLLRPLPGPVASHLWAGPRGAPTRSVAGGAEPWRASSRRELRKN